MQRLQFVEHAHALPHARAVGDQQRRQRLAGAAAAGCREAVAGEHPARCDQRVELIGLAAPAALRAPRSLDLDDTDPDCVREQVLAQPRAIAAGTLDPDHDLPRQARGPLGELGIAAPGSADRALTDDLAAVIERADRVLVFVSIDAKCDHRGLLILTLCR